jgi:hypothetical protein
MTYSINSTLPAGLGAAITSALIQAQVGADVQAELLTAAGSVTLETGDTVCVSCIVHDRIETPQVDFITVAIACKAGVPWIKPNGQVVASVYWHGIWPDMLSSIGIGVVRKALQMVVLSEPQPQIAIPNPVAGGPTTQNVFPGLLVQHIRMQIEAATQIAMPLVSVL